MPYTSPYVDTLMVDGTDLQSLTGIVVQDLSGLFAPGTRRGSNDVIPGRDGQVGAALPLDAYSFSIPIVVDGGTDPDPVARRAVMVANLRAAVAAVGGQSTGGLVALTRRLGKVGGGYDIHTADGQHVALNTFSLMNFDNGKTDLEFINLNGAWLDGSTWIVP